MPGQEKRGSISPDKKKPGDKDKEKKKKRKKKVEETVEVVEVRRPRITSLDFRSLRSTLQLILRKIDNLLLPLIKNCSSDKAVATFIEHISLSPFSTSHLPYRCISLVSLLCIM